MRCNYCKNNNSERNYCNVCGEKITSERLTFKLLSDLILNVLNLNEGFLFTLNKLIFKPKSGFQDYIIGRRRKYMNPVKFVIILISIKVVISSFFFSEKESVEILLMNKPYWTPLVLLIFIISSTLISYSILRSNFNIIEHIVVNLFLFGLMELFSILSSLIKITLSYFDLNQVVSISSLIAQMLLIFYIYQQVFSKTKIKILLASSLCFILYYFILIVTFNLMGYNFN